MIIKKITVCNWRIFKDEHSFVMRPINLIIGKIGMGKSSLGRMPIPFALYGYSEVALSDLKCKWSDGKTWVELMIEDRGDVILVKREIPSKVSILLNGVEILPEATTPSKNDWLKQRFNDLDYFKKFRMIDVKEGINILDQGKTSLKNTLVSFHESALNGIKKNLQEKKNLYEKFNKDHSVVFKHYPSQKRYDFLLKKESEFSSRINDINSKLSNLRSDLSDLESQRAIANLDIKRNNFAISEAKTQEFCSSCSQKLPTEGRKSIIEQSSKVIEQAKAHLTNLQFELQGQVQAVNYMEANAKRTWQIKERLNYFKTRLAGRLKQSNFKYTNKDVLLVSTALKELDKFYSFYILESVKQLEPIINSIIVKIGFKVSFILTEKGDFDIILNKEGYDYSYKELSTGQRLMLSIAFQLSLLLDKGDTGVIVADEGFGNLDEESMLTLYEMLKELPFQVISIIHRFETNSRDINIIKLEGIQNGQ